MKRHHADRLCFRFAGGRFGNGIPTEVLPSLAELATLIADVAWRDYSQETGATKRTKAFNESTGLKLVAIEAGSTVAALEPTRTTAMLPGLDQYEPFLWQGVDQVHQVVSAAHRGVDPSFVMERELLAKFGDILPDLRHDESMEFPSSTGSEASYALMTPKTRNGIIEASKTPTVVKKGSIYAFVPEINKRTGSFELQAADGSAKMKVKFQDPHFNALKVAWESYRGDIAAGNPVRVVGELEYGQLGTVRKVNSVDAIETLSPFDVRARLQYFSSLRDGWFNGKGSKFEPQYLVTLADRFDKWFPIELGNPAIFPHVEGTIGCEWTLPRGECILTVDPQSDKGEWIDFSLENENDTTERTLRLGEESEWQWLRGRLAARTADGSR